MQVFIATLATPTITSELYGDTLLDLAQMYATKPFSSEEKALEWATKIIKDEHEAELAEELKLGIPPIESEVEEFKLLTTHSYSFAHRDGKFWIWTPNGEDDGEPQSSEKIGYCLIVEVHEID